jgi:hypothetical protein
MFADMPLDNRAVDQFAALASRLAVSENFETPPRTKRSNISSWLIVL